MYIADSINHVIRMVTPGGTVSTVYGTYYDLFAPGSTGCRYAGDNGMANSASVFFCNPTDVMFDVAGNLFITDTSNNVIRKVRN